MTCKSNFKENTKNAKNRRRPDFHQHVDFIPNFAVHLLLNQETATLYLNITIHTKLYHFSTTQKYRDLSLIKRIKYVNKRTTLTKSGGRLLYFTK